MRKWLLLIFLLALVFRFWQLAKYPEALDEDEMALGYYGYSLISNGTDEYGHKFPLYFESAGDYKYGLYSYLDTVPIFLFGLNNITTRSIAALAGAFSVIVIYYLAFEIFPDKLFACFSALALAVSPMHIHFSRVAYNNILGALLAYICLLYYLRYLKKQHWKLLVLTIVFALLSYFSYQAYRIFIPAALTVIAFITFFTGKKFNKKIMIVPVIVILFAILSFIPAESRRRTQDISLLTSQPKIIEEQAEDTLGRVPLFVTRMFHNKPLDISFGLLTRYVAYFDPAFLFLRTTTNTERHAIPGIGVVNIIDAIFIILGVITFFHFIKSRYKYVPFILLFVSPLAASTVIEDRSLTRAIVLTYGLALFSGAGLYWLYTKISFKRIYFFTVAMLYALSLFYFVHQYTIHKVFHQPWYSDYGLKEMVDKVNHYSSSYEHVVLSHGHYISFLYYNKIKPADFLKAAEISANYTDSGLRIKSFGKLVFNMPYECPVAGKKNTLYICFGYQVPKLANYIDVIRFRDGQPALTLVDFNKPPASNLPERVKRNEDSDKRFADGVIPDSYETFWPTN